MGTVPCMEARMAATNDEGMTGGRRRGDRRKRQVPIPFTDRRKGPRRRDEAARCEPLAR